MSTPLKKNSSGDSTGNYYTAPGATPEERYENFKALPAPAYVDGKYNLGGKYNCPNDKNYGPFTGEACQKDLGPIANNKPWSPFAAANAFPGALPLPLTIDSTVEGFKFSTPPTFNFGGHVYWPTLPEKTVQLLSRRQ